MLFIHNRYRQPGGEDEAVNLEINLLTGKGHDTKSLIFHNKPFSGWFKGLLAVFTVFYNFSSARKLRKLIREFKPDIMHVHNIFFMASPSVLYTASRCRIPVIFTLHNYRLICANALLLRQGRVCEKCVQNKFPFAGIRYKCYRNSAMQTAMVTLVTGIHKLLRTWVNKVTTYISLNEFSGNRIKDSSLRIPKEQMATLPNFVEDPGETEQPREDFFLFAGRIAKEKGVHILCQAFSRLPAYNIMIIGDGPEKKVLQLRYTDCPNIIFLGFMEKSTVLSYMKRCRAFICPSIWYEGAPLTIIEAFSTGTPVIASKLGSMEESIIHGYNGFHFDAGNVTHLEETVKIFSEKIKDMDQLYKNARLSYMDKYHPEVHYRTLMNIYQHALKKYA